MKKKKIAFDVDGTLVEAYNQNSGKPNYRVIDMFRVFQKLGHEMIIWSGGGVDYAYQRGDQLGLHPFKALPKQAGQNVDIAFDDEEVELATVNIQV